MSVLGVCECVCVCTLIFCYNSGNGRCLSQANKTNCAMFESVCFSSTCSSFVANVYKHWVYLGPGQTSLFFFFALLPPPFTLIKCQVFATITSSIIKSMIWYKCICCAVSYMLHFIKKNVYMDPVRYVCLSSFRLLHFFLDQFCSSCVCVCASKLRRSAWEQKKHITHTHKFERWNEL